MAGLKAGDQALDGLGLVALGREGGLETKGGGHGGIQPHPLAAHNAPSGAVRAGQEPQAQLLWGGRLEKLLQTLAPAWPAYHLAQVAQQAVGVGAGRPLGLHLAVLAAITAVFFMLARRRLVQ